MELDTWLKPFPSKLLKVWFACSWLLMTKCEKKDMKSLSRKKAELKDLEKSQPIHIAKNESTRVWPSD